jgi:hypothetical protein
MKRDSKINWMRGCGGIYTKIICDYVRVFPMYLVEKYIDPLPLSLSRICRKQHYHFRERMTTVVLASRVCKTKYLYSYEPSNLQCKNCPTFHERKELVRLFRELSTNYGLWFC